MASPIGPMVDEQARQLVELHRRNASGWERQAARIRARGKPVPDSLTKAIAEALAAADAIEQALTAERERRARVRYSNQARRVGDALTEKE